MLQETALTRDLGLHLVRRLGESSVLGRHYVVRNARRANFWLVRHSALRSYFLLLLILLRLYIILPSLECSRTLRFRDVEEGLLDYGRCGFVKVG